MQFPRNVLYLTHRDRIIGGGEVSLFELIGRLDRKKFRPFLLMSGGSDMLELAKKCRVMPKLMKLPQIRPGNAVNIILSLLRLSGFIHGKKIKILHANTSRAMFYGGIVAMIFRISIVWHVRIIDKDPRADPILYHLATIVICNSKATSHRFGGFRNLEKIKIVYNGLAPSKYYSVEKRTIFEDIPKDQKIVLNIGRLDSWKRQDLFIEIADIIIKGQKNVKFILVGEDKSPEKKFYKKLKKMANDMNLSGVVKFMGERNNIPDLLSESDLLVLTSKEEPFGRVILEAGASQKPVVSFDGGGVGEIIEDEKTGFLVKDRDIQAMAQKILLLLSDAELRTQMGILGRKKVMTEFTSSAHARKIEKIYEELK